MRASSEHDTERLLSKEQSSELDFSTTLVTQKGVLRRWRTHLRDNHNQVVGTVIVLCFSNIATVLILLLVLSKSRTQDLAVNQPPGGLPPTFSHLVQKPTPTFVNVSWYPPENSFFREHNSVEADENWRWYDASNGGYVIIPKEEAEAADIDPARHAYIDRPDLGIQGYPVLPEAIHEMHCVNMLRRNLYYNIDHTRANCHPPNCEPPELENWRIQHVEVAQHLANEYGADHCLEIVRNRVACTADLGIVPFMWYGPNGKLAGDMARMHTCSNYEVIRKFVMDNGLLPGETKGLLSPPEGAFITDLRD